MTEPEQMDTPPAVDGLAGMLAQLGGVVLSTETLETAVALVTTLAAVTIPGTAGAGVTLVDGRGRRTTAASDPLVSEADALQYEFDSGPCLTAWSPPVRRRMSRVPWNFGGGPVSIRLRSRVDHGSRR